MDKLGNIEITVFGKKGNLDLTPGHYDVKEIMTMLENVEDLLYPASKKDRPLITYDIQAGSVKHVFTTSMQAIIGFSAVLSQVQKSGSIDFLELKTAQAIENLQHFSYQKNYDFELRTSISQKETLRITPESQYLRKENIWVDTELYFYGTLTNAGGKNKVNIHLDTDEFGLLTIDTDKDYLVDQEDNVLYKKYGVRAFGKQNIETGEIDRNSLKLVKLVDFDPAYDENYLSGLIQKARGKWRGIDTDKWLNELRGSYDA